MVETAVGVHDILKEKGYDCTLVNVRFIKPIDEEMLCAAAREHLLIDHRFYIRFMFCH